MKIVSIDSFYVGSFLLVEITTDTGLQGLGESGAWAHQSGVQAILRDRFAPLLIGQDPRRIEWLWQRLYRAHSFRGAPVMGALSAVDLALWDLLGKSLGVPCHVLLGGRVRDRVRLYTHVLGPTPESLVEGCLAAKAAGFTAVGHLNPFLDEPRDVPYFKPHARKIAEAIDVVRRCREAVGDDVDLCLELHRRLTEPEAIALGRELAPFRPLFLEDPTIPDNFDVMARIARSAGVPIATGERLHGVEEFAMLLSREAAHYVRVSVCLCGGLSSARKIAALAEGHGVAIVPHNPLTPVSLAACAQLAACTTNFAIQEYPDGMDTPPKATLLRTPLHVEQGFLRVPEGPGLGIELAPDVARAKTPSSPPSPMRQHVDGSWIVQ